ncbi:MAG TPA: ISL3 family transposase [Acidocella sp.]|nr:ISL3 family transposase [Acidocella sp.]
MAKTELKAEVEFDALELSNLKAISETTDSEGRKIVTVQSRQVTAPICCLAQKLVKNGRKPMAFQDFPRNRTPVSLLVKRQRWTCLSCKSVIYEDLPDIDTKRDMTRRLCAAIGADAVVHTFQDAAQFNGVTVSTARRVFLDLAEEQLADYRFEMPRVLGIDEKVIMGRPRLVIGDVANRVMLDMQKSRRSVDLDAYFSRMPGRDKVEVVCQDMWRDYVVITNRHFPNAVTVVDKFHVVRLGDYGLSNVRKSLYKDIPSGDRQLLKRRISLLKSRWDRAGDRVKESLGALFHRWPRLGDAYWAKEGLYGIYDAPDRYAAEMLADEWLAKTDVQFRVEFKDAMTALRNWRPHILRYFEHRYTNAYIERLNGLVAEMNTRGKGYDFDTLRAKAILKYSMKFSKLDPLYTGPVVKQRRQGPQPDRIMVWCGLPLSTLEVVFRSDDFWA